MNDNRNRAWCLSVIAVAVSLIVAKPLAPSAPSLGVGPALRIFIAEYNRSKNAFI